MIKTYQQSNYTIALLLSTSKKTCESLAKTLEVSGDAMLRELKISGGTRAEFINLAKKILRKNKKIYLIIDDTLIEKIYSTYIEGTSDNFDSSKSQTYRSLCTIVAMLSDGKYAIPVDHAFWINKEFCKDGYKTKAELVIEVIKNITKDIEVDCVIMDGLFALVEIIKFLNIHQINFEMRFHSNRKIQTEDGKSISIKNLFDKIMTGRGINLRTVSGYWYEEKLFFTAVRRFRKDKDSIIVYQISNYKSTPREHERVYSLRWRIEQFFRTAKQKLGLKDCQSRKILSQDNHIRYIFKAYAILESERKLKHLKNPEQALERLKRKSYSDIIHYLSSANQIFGDIIA